MRLLNENKKLKSRHLEIVYVSIEDLQPNSYNPNVHTTTSFDLLIKSISYFGMTQPIVVREETMEIVDGENRWRAASIVGLQEVPVCLISLSCEEMKIATIIHNRARGSEIEAQISEIDKELMQVAPELIKDLLLYERYDIKKDEV